MDSKRFMDSLTDMFMLDSNDLKRIVSDFHTDMKKGLAGKESSLKMLPAYTDKARGTELGKYLALDLGGTNFRVLEVDLDGSGKTRVLHVGKFAIPGAVMRGTGEQLFNFIAQSIHAFLTKNKIGVDEKMKLGFTFSFPINQTSIKAGVLITWTKGFSASGVVGKDVTRLLAESLKRYGIDNIEIVALANDTVGTMAAGSYADPNCDMGIIFGTGTNACYREKGPNVVKMKGAFGKRERVIINVEWGNFNRLPVNDYDRRLDRSSGNPGRQIMEKMISGMYLGEIARIVLSDMTRSKIIFAQHSVKFPKGAFATSHMSMIEADGTKNLAKAQDYLDGIGIADSSLSERALLKKVCRIVSRRAARVSAAAISAVMTWMDPKLKNEHTIAIDGTLYERYPGFRRAIVSTLKELHGEGSRRLKIVRAKDGSGIGVAIVAAVARR